MFSSRFPRDLRPNRLARAIEAQRREGKAIVDLTESNPTRAGFVYPPEIVSAFSDEGLIRYDPAPAGSPGAREAVAEYYAFRGRHVEPERILEGVLVGH